MSGGSLNYVYSDIEDASREIFRRLRDDDCGFSQADRETLKLCSDVMDQVAGIAHDIEWIFSGDYGTDEVGALIEPLLDRIRDLLKERPAE